MAEMVTEISNFYIWTKNRLIKFLNENIEVRWPRGTLGTISQFYNPKPEIVFRNFCAIQEDLLGTTNPENMKGIGGETRQKLRFEFVVQNFW